MGRRYIARVVEWQTRMFEGHVAVEAVGVQISSRAPYGGIKYSKAKGKLLAAVSGTEYESGNVKNKDKVGLFVGCSILPLKNFGLNIEGRFLDEEALTISGQVRF